MTKRYLVILAILCLSFGISQAQVPGTPAGRQFQAWLEAFNSGERAKLQEFFEKSFPGRLPRIEQSLSMRAQSGGFDFKETEESTETRFSALIQARGRGQTFRAVLEVDPAEPHRILRLNLMPAARLEEAPVARMSESDLLAALRTRLESDAASDRFAGAVLIAKNGKPIFTGAYGLAGRKRPVMVYMHGGGFSGGSGNDLLSYDGENLARHHDVVVVTHNHRLNAFGFLNLAELGGERYAASGNVGMLDNVAVLEWVRDNVASFGGDPANVMIYGQSGGGGKVSTLMVMPAAKGLFHRAAVQSGSALKSGSPENSTRLAAAVLEELNLSKAQLEKIHTVPAAALMAAQAAALRRIAGPGPFGASGRGWGPVMDGKIIPAHPFDPVAPAISASVPMLIGTCLNEMVNGVDNPEVGTLTGDELMKRASQRYGAKAGDIIAAYRREYPKEPPFGLWAAISAAGQRQNAITQAERKAAQGAAPVYQYIYAWRTPVLDGRPGSFHSSEIAFVFDNADLCVRYSGGGPEALALSSIMGAAWAAFARDGNPGHRRLPKWPAFTAEQRATMIFDNRCAVKSDPEGEGLRLIRRT